jgi:hypothetical protein
MARHPTSTVEIESLDQCSRAELRSLWSKLLGEGPPACLTPSKYNCTMSLVMTSAMLNRYGIDNHRCHMTGWNTTGSKSFV